MADTFKALVADNKTGDYQVEFRDLPEQELPSGEVSIAVEYSTLNYKDALAITNKAPIVQNFPLILGIDLAGKIVESNHRNFKSGDVVLVNGFGLSERHNGGYTQRAHVNGDSVIHIPKGLTTKKTMAIGTAGYTAMLSVMRLQEGGVKPESGPILVTGAVGGVGSISISLLKKLGYQVIASTGRKNETEYLKSLGADEVIDRNILSASAKPLQKTKWAGAIDSVGSHTLANVIAQTNYNGVVTTCGLAQGADLPATVMPFILRNVALLGVDSVNTPIERRVEAWNRLDNELETKKIEEIARVVAFSDIMIHAISLLEGNIRGRVIVDINQI